VVSLINNNAKLALGSAYCGWPPNAGLTRLRKLNSHSLLDDISTPNPIRPTPPEFLPRTLLVHTPRRLTKNDLQVPSLATGPPPNEVRRILTHAGEESVFGFRVLDGFNHEGKLVVVGDDLAEGSGVGWVGSQGEHLGAQWVFHRYADVVNGGGGVAVVIGVDADGVGQFEGWERGDVWNDEVGDVWEEELVGSKYLWGLYFSRLQDQIRVS